MQPPPSDTQDRDVREADSEAWKVLEPQDALRMIQEELGDTKNKLNAQAVLDKAVKEHFEALSKRWKSEMDTLLIYAALFSAILTAFNVGLYKLLRPDPMDDAVATLKQLSQQLNSYSINLPFVNSTQRVPPANDVDSNTTKAHFLPPRSIIVINTLWFSSLVFSLASASLALLVKQWLYELTYRIPSTSREGAQLRQHRLDNLAEWHIPTIITIIPLLLQIALVLFLVGLVLLLWPLQDTVAMVTTIWVALLFTFLVVFTILPAFNWRCSYRSPQAFIIYAGVRAFHDGFIKLARAGLAHYTNLISLSVKEKHRSKPWWSKLRDRCKRISGWTLYGPWEARERAYLKSPATSLSLDIATGTTACTETLDPNCLESLLLVMAEKCATPSLASCLRSLDWMEDISQSNRAALMMRSDPQTLPRFIHYALLQMFTIPHAERLGPKIVGWEQDVVKLRDSLNRLHVDLLDEKFLHMNFMIAIEAKSMKNVREALTYLAGAVSTSRSPPKYSTLVRVLSSAVQWLEHERTDRISKQIAELERQAEALRTERLAGRAEPPPPVANPPPPVVEPTQSPQNVLLAFSIVVHCALCVIKGTVVVPELRRGSFEDLCAQANVAVLLRSLPRANDLTTHPVLSKDFMAGLNTLLRPLTRLSRCMVEAARADMPLPLDMAFLIREDFVQALVDGYISAQKGLPKEKFPLLMVPGILDLHERLAALGGTLQQHFRVGEQGLFFENEAS